MHALLLFVHISTATVQVSVILTCAFVISVINLHAPAAETITFMTTAPNNLIFQTTDNAPHAIHTASIDPQIRNDPQHRAEKDLRCGMLEHPYHMWHECSNIPHRRSSPPQNMVTFLTNQQRLSLFVRGGRAAPTYINTMYTDLFFPLPGLASGRQSICLSSVLAHAALQRRKSEGHVH